MTPPSAIERPSAARDPWLWFALILAWAWVLLPAWINSSQAGDHFEQFTWAHSMEWGYHKHPPLPTWLLALAIKLCGATPYASYVVSALVITGTAVFTYLVARALLGQRIASLAIVLWGLHWAFTQRAQLLNHNSVMMCCIAAAAWLALQASRQRSAWADWVLLGLVSGLALLAKYQSAVPLFGLILALWRAGALREPRQRLGLALACAISLLVFAPHVRWVVQHDFVTLRYATQTVHQLDLMQRLARVLSFSAIQLRMLVSVLLCLAALSLWARWHPSPARSAAESDAPVGDAQRSAWLLGLLGWPLLVLAGLCLAQGVELQDHWGFQAVQFISLWLAWRMRHLADQPPARLIGVALLLQALSMAVYAQPLWNPRVLASGGRFDQFYPAQALADAVMRDWQRATPCPLRYVVGPTYEAGMVSVYSGANPAVLEAGQSALSPWIDLADLQQAGAVYVGHSSAELPVGLTPRQQEFRPAGSERSAYDVYWAIAAPRGCGAASATR